MFPVDVQLRARRDVDTFNRFVTVAEKRNYDNLKLRMKIKVSGNDFKTLVDVQK